MTNEKNQKLTSAGVEQHLVPCENCGIEIDGRTAKHQTEWMWFGKKKIKVISYYCSACYALLTNIGKGERTPMQDAAMDLSGDEPYGKNDY